MTAQSDVAVICEFYGLEAEMTLAVTTAVVDQLCAQADADALLLEAIDLPLLEIMDALHQADAALTSISAAIVDANVLAIDLVTESDLASPDSLFDDGLELIEAFFEVKVSADAIALRLELS